MLSQKKHGYTTKLSGFSQMAASFFQITAPNYPENYCQ
jgi:hypothetical protein